MEHGRLQRCVGIWHHAADPSTAVSDSHITVTLYQQAQLSILTIVTVCLIPAVFTFRPLKLSSRLQTKNSQVCLDNYNKINWILSERTKVYL